ncbi:MAG TPA: AAA family ATPase [Thermoleophilaceae bacterium]
MLYGRDAERARIAELLDRARGGQSGVLVLRGEAGVGKSALLDDARERAAGMTVLSGGGVESEAQLPYAGLHQLVRPVLHHHDKLPEPQARALRGALGLETGARDEWFLVSAGVLSLLAEAAEERPLLCLVDDAHWLDDASAEALVFAARRLGAEGIAMVFAAREGDVRTFEGPGLPELRVGGLHPDDAGQLLDGHARRPLSPEARERLIAETGGNPLALLTLSSVLSEGQLAGTEPLLDPLPVSARVEHAFLARVRELPAETQILLLVAAADDSGELATILAAAEELGSGAEALDAADRAELVRIDGRRLEFTHPLVRSAVYYGAPLSKRQAAHRALADVLVDESDADRRAWHRAAGSIEPHADVVNELEHAAQRARQRSGFVAASLAFERAAAMTSEAHHQLRLLTGAVESAWFGGRLERALVLLDRARPNAREPIEQAELDRWRGLIEVNVGVPADACDLLVRGAREMAPVDSERALYMLAIASTAAGYAGDPERVVAIAESSAAVPAVDTPVTRFLARFLVGAGAFFAGAYEQAAAELRATLTLADDADASAGIMFPGLLLFAGASGLFLGDDLAASRYNGRLAAQTRESGALTLLTQTIPRYALSEIWMGRWPSAAAGLNEGRELAEQAGQRQVVGHILSNLALVAALRGDEESCRSLAAEGRELAAARRLFHVEQTARWALLQLELGRGAAEAALIGAREITRPPVTLWAGLDRVEAAVRAGEPELAREWLAPFEAWATPNGAGWALGAASHCRALLAGDNADAERLFTTALDFHSTGGRPFERARTQLAFGEFLRRARRRVEAREHLRLALDTFETLRAELWAARARTELRASGQTARRREPSTRDDLTPQELQIARLVAQGMTNREVAAHLILSPRTIDFHLRNVFRKLDISSRMQLAGLDLDGDEEAAERGSPSLASRP